MKNLQIGLEEDVVDYLDKVAEEQNKTRTAVIREAIDHWIKRTVVEDFEAKWIASLEREGAKYPDDGDDLWAAAEKWGET